ncbi:MAG TPA: MerR family transcriptional regulator [Burkholderiaceae bacterium]
MPTTLTDPAQKYLRLKCGMPATTMRPAALDADPDDPEQRLLTTAEAAAAAHVDEARIRDWARRGLIKPVATPNGQPVYRELDVLAVEAATRRAARERALAAEAMEGLGNAPA